MDGVRQGSDEALQRAFTYGLLQAGRHWRKAANAAVRGNGLSDATAFPLVLIGRADGDLRQTALAEAAGIEGPSLVRLLDQLCAAGLVVRQEDPTDRRAKTLGLTPRGQQVFTRIEADLARMRRTVFAGLRSADFAASLRLFQALADHVEPADDGLEAAQ